jgi:hypothetical protein
MSDEVDDQLIEIEETLRQIREAKSCLSKHIEEELARLLAFLQKPDDETP